MAADKAMAYKTLLVMLTIRTCAKTPALECQVTNNPPQMKCILRINGTSPRFTVNEPLLHNPGSHYDAAGEKEACPNLIAGDEVKRFLLQTGYELSNSTVCPTFGMMRENKCSCDGSEGPNTTTEPAIMENLMAELSSQQPRGKALVTDNRTCSKADLSSRRRPNKTAVVISVVLVWMLNS
ncbi:uncharacterized protein LOC110977536 [Acanthaster planci]|uniref:Uncharacterized protein LOC110977536 n=1 Tax=Acanthaster planci TaxID=133434 RepID=A0A8B7Y6Q2_ACAPL|nr:uncharacterized protein LOC110977536 [Acanthaster planci]XP_022087466.1 uncharacterized protein LOC110977536 [Acanthaster planci]